jgi:hypothetical protein
LSAVAAALAAKPAGPSVALARTPAAAAPAALAELKLTPEKVGVAGSSCHAACFLCNR